MTNRAVGRSPNPGSAVSYAMRVGSIPSDGPDNDYKKYARPLAHELAAIRARG